MPIKAHPIKGRYIEKDEEDELVNNVTIDDNNCWNWDLGKDKYGYGYMYIKYYQRTIATHRVSYAMFNSFLPKNKLVCHHCDNPSCINPDHLFIGTTTDNIRDAQIKGHMAKKLEKDDVREIVKRLKNGESNYKIANDYPVNYKTIDNIKRGNLWEHITGIEEPIGNTRKFNDNDIKEICKDYFDNNLDTREIAEKYNTSIDYIGQILRGERHPSVERETTSSLEVKKKISDQEVKEICYRYIKSDENISQEKLGEEYGLSQGQIYRLVHGMRRKDVERPTK